MQSTTVVVSGKGTNPKLTLYVGGLEENVNEAVLHSVFIPFGEIKDVNIPLDNTSGKHRGFGFVEFEAKEDAAAAIDNMHNAELYGRELARNPFKVQMFKLGDSAAQPMKIKGGDKGFSHLPVWADADDWYERQMAEQDLEKLEEAEKKKASAKISEKFNAKNPMQELEEAVVS